MKIIAQALKIIVGVLCLLAAIFMVAALVLGHAEHINGTTSDIIFRIIVSLLISGFMWFWFKASNEEFRKRKKRLQAHKDKLV